MEGAAQFRIAIGYQIGSNPDNAVGDIQRAGRIAQLVGHHGNLITIARKARHRLHEIYAEGAADPTHAQHRAVVAIGDQHALLARQLGGAVDARRLGRIAFQIGATPPPT
ncbi:hypothetical protein TomTYG45_11030 [Sphingobium sp. TomTYG45]